MCFSVFICVNMLNFLEGLNGVMVTINRNVKMIFDHFKRLAINFQMSVHFQMSSIPK